MDARIVKVTLAVLLMCASFPSLVSGQVRLELNVLEQGEKPLADMAVWLIPSSGTPETGFTDENGRVQFSFAPTAYVSVLLQSPIAPEIPRMSGRFSQKTSVYLGGMYQGTETKYGSAGGQVDHLERLLDALEDKYQGDSLPDEVQDMLRWQRIRERVEAGTAAPDFWGDSLDKNRVQSNPLLDRVDRLLESPADWYLGIVPEYSVHGAYVRSVTNDTPASRSGIRPGDWITSVNGARVGKLEGESRTLPSLFANSDAGHVVLEILRPSGRSHLRRTIEVQLESR